jgi:hypothetical protein
MNSTHLIPAVGLPKEVTMSSQFRLVRKGTLLATLAATLAVAAPAQAIPSHLDGIHPSSSPVNAGGTDVGAADQQSPRTPDGRGAARPNSPSDVSAALAQERYYSSYEGRPKTPSDVTAALAQERYFSSYGQDVEPLSRPAPAVVADDGDGIAPLPFVVSIVGALILGLGAGTGLHLLRFRRRQAAGLVT